jgi:adenylate cyclase, class 2
MSASQQFEVEQKFRVAAFEPVRQRLVELGAQFAPPIEQADTYFSHPARNFAQSDEALRLRRVGEANCITYKGPKMDAETKTRRELELPLPAGTAACEQYAELLRTLGFAEVATVRKRRETARLDWEAHEVEVALDVVEGVGQFAELEIGADASGLPAARQAIGSLAEKLGLTDSERRSYMELLLGPSP